MMTCLSEQQGTLFDNKNKYLYLNNSISLNLYSIKLL